MFFWGSSQRAFERSVQKFEELKVHAQQKAEIFKQRNKIKKHATLIGMLVYLEELQKNVVLLFAEGSWWRARRKAALFCSGVNQLRGLMRSFLQEIVELCFFVCVLFVLKAFIIGYYSVPTGSAEPNLLVGDRVWVNKLAYSVKSPKHGEMVMFEDPEFTYESSGTLAYYWQKYIGFGIPLLGLPEGPRLFTKRIIGLPGDTIEGRIESKKPVIYRNGKRLEEPYLNTYPLILLYKHTGFFENRGLWKELPMPEFLRKRRSLVRYSYDPEKSFDEQPFYRLNQEDICHDSKKNELILFYPNDYVPQDTFGPIVVPQGYYWGQGDSRRNSHDSRFFGLVPEKLIQGRLSFILFSIDSEEAFWLFEFFKNPYDFWSKHIRWNRFFKSLSTWNGFDGTNDNK